MRRPVDSPEVAMVDGAGRVFAYEFLAVSRGVSLDGIGADDAALIREALQSVGQLAVA